MEKEIHWCFVAFHDKDLSCEGEADCASDVICDFDLSRKKE